MVGERDERPTVADTATRVKITEPTWLSTADGAVRESCTSAVWTSVLAGGAALCTPDAAQPVTLQGT